MRVPAAISSYVCFLPLSRRDILTLGVVYLPPAVAATVLLILTRRLTRLAALTRVLTLRSAELDQTGRSIRR